MLEMPTEWWTASSKWLKPSTIRLWTPSKFPTCTWSSTRRLLWALGTEISSPAREWLTDWTRSTDRVTAKLALKKDTSPSTCSSVTAVLRLNSTLSPRLGRFDVRKRNDIPECGINDKGIYMGCTMGMYMGIFNLFWVVLGGFAFILQRSIQIKYIIPKLLLRHLQSSYLN